MNKDIIQKEMTQTTRHALGQVMRITLDVPSKMIIIVTSKHHLSQCIFLLFLLTLYYFSIAGSLAIKLFQYSHNFVGHFVGLLIFPQVGVVYLVLFKIPSDKMEHNFLLVKFPSNYQKFKM